MLRNPAKVMGSMTDSPPPTMATSARPEAIRRAPAAMACVPAAQAVVIVSTGPRQPNRMATCAAPALGMIIGARNGETRLAPRSSSTCCWATRVPMPPMPVPMMTADRSASNSLSPLSVTASTAAATVTWAKRSTRRTSLGPKKTAGSKSGIMRSPEKVPSRSPAKSADTPTPQHDSAPRPVTTTRLPWTGEPATVPIRITASR